MAEWASLIELAGISSRLPRVVFPEPVLCLQTHPLAHLEAKPVKRVPEKLWTTSVKPAAGFWRPATAPT